jgi:outer membrane protein OmpA-like peptidoglycan-associated protein
MALTHTLSRICLFSFASIQLSLASPCLNDTTPKWSLSGNYYIVNGTVFVEKDKKPKEGAWVMAYKVVRSSGGETTHFRLDSEFQTDTSDRKGKFDLRLLAEDEYEIHCIKEGYGARPFQLYPKKVSAGQTISIEIGLFKSNSNVFFGQFTDAATGKPIGNVEVQIRDLSHNISRTLFTDGLGNFVCTLEEGGEYMIIGLKRNYFYFLSDKIEHQNEKETIRKQFSMIKLEVGQAVTIFDAVFEIMSDSLQPTRAVVLDEIIHFMQLNPYTIIEIGCHTDSRGDDDYNQTLTEKRAQNIRTFLINKGLPASRLTSKGYGEAKLLNQCSNGVKCPTSEHLKNRRITYTIVGFTK